VRVLALEPFFGGSHRAFLDGWQHHSRHQWTVLGLPPHHWKWRMRHSAVTMSTMINNHVAGGSTWDVVIASDMLNLAEFRGLVRQEVATLPTVMYFHENQLTYPSQVEDDRDLHLAYTNFTSAVAAEAVWFNSVFHRSDFLSACDAWLARMPDYRHSDCLKSIELRSAVMYPGIEPVGTVSRHRNPEPLLIWPARWEHDKNPELLAAAVMRLTEDDLPFRLRLLGQAFRATPPALEALAERLGDRLVNAVLPRDRGSYYDALRQADIVVSTADHEFFGMAIVEAISAGCYPVLSNRLAYPEVLRCIAGEDTERYLYDGTEDSLVAVLETVIRRFSSGSLWRDGSDLSGAAAAAFGWQHRAGQLDYALEAVAG
jgi:glycosyltransferase involved in cell wall biosynthesis